MVWKSGIPSDMERAMQSIQEQIRARVIEEQQRTAGLKVYKYRNEADDGWCFVVGKGKVDAKKRVPHWARHEIIRATYDDVYQIAVRALA